MKMLGNTEPELKKNVAYNKSIFAKKSIFLFKTPLNLNFTLACYGEISEISWMNNFLSETPLVSFSSI